MPQKVLVIGEAKHASILLGTAVANEDWEIHRVSSTDEALSRLRNESPDLVILDLPHASDGMDRWRRLWEEKGDGRQLPVLPIYSRNRISSLPAMAEIEAEMERLMDYGEDFCFLHLNLCHFRGYNKVNGFASGDKLLRSMGELIEEACQEAGGFAGHIGGDEFLIVTPLGSGQDLADELMTRFAGLQARHFRTEDLARGFVSHLDRQGKVEEVPVLGLTVCVIPKVGGNFSHLGEIWNSVAELRGYARKHGGNFVALERRVTPPGFWREEEEQETRLGSGTEGL